MSVLQSILFGAGFRFKDATGKRLKLYDQLQQASHEPPIPSPTFNSIRTECNKYELTHTQRGLQAFLVILGIWQIANVIINARTSAAPLRDGVIGGLVTLAFWIGAWGISKLVRASPAVYGNELLAHAHCAACGYAISPARTSTTTCSECGAQWLSEKIGREIPITAPDTDASGDRLTPSLPPHPSPCTSQEPSQAQPR